MKKKKAIIITLIGILLLGVLIWYLQKPKGTNNVKPSIDTGKIEETNLKWEDIVNVDISGFEGDIVANITYKEIPDLQEKINKEEAKWNEIKDTLDSEKDASTIDEYYAWLSEIRKPYDEEFCQLPSDLNNYTNGDKIKVTCDSEVLRKLNYKFNDGLEITIDNLAKRLDDETMKERQQQTPINEPIVEENKTEEIDDTKQNVYTVVSDTFVVAVRDLSTVNLFQIENKNQRVLIDVKTAEDFETVKKHALEYGNIDYIQYNDEVYYASEDFKEANVWKGFTVEESKD